MNFALQQNLNHLVHPVKASARAATRNAGDTGAAAVINGSEIDLAELPRTFRTAQLVQPFRITQAASKSVTVGVKGQHRSSTSGAGSTWADVTAAAHGGSTGSKTVSSTGATDALATTSIPLSGLKRYFRTRTTPAFSATATGPTLDLDAAVVVFAGADRTPAQG